MAQLGPGVEVRIEGVDFRITGLLGEGSFGAVWGARASSGPDCYGEVAIKEILCRSETELLRAVMERKLLKFVKGPTAGSDDSPAIAAARRFPSLVASEVEALGADFWQVRLAMTRLAGKPLESLLDGCQDELQACAAGEPPAPLAQTASCRLADASRCVRSMLQQLAPALEHLSSRAHHRDITPRNVLVDVIDGSHSWGLVDFGLAVDSAKWRREMLTHDIGGDGHYWPTSSWFVLAYGAHHLESYPALLQEYEQCLDLHALGITALRTFMEFWAPKYQKEDVESVAGEDWAQCAKLIRLQIAWSRFWHDIAHFWQPIFDAFACGGAEALERLKSNYAHAGVHHMVSADLCAVRAALRELREVAVLPDLRVVCDALLVMVRPGKAREDAASWPQVLAALAGAGSQHQPSCLDNDRHADRRCSQLNHVALCDALKGDICRHGPSASVTTQSTCSRDGSVAGGSVWSSASVHSQQSPTGSAVVLSKHLVPLVHVA